jgi:hypothetical protein
MLEADSVLAIRTYMSAYPTHAIGLSPLELLTGAVYKALSRSFVLLVNRAWRSLPICLYFNALGPRGRTKLAQKPPILGECDNALHCPHPSPPAKSSTGAFSAAVLLRPARTNRPLQ